MKRITLSLIAIGILMLATLATPAQPAQAFFGARVGNEMYGGMWNSPGDFQFRHQGIYGDTYVSRQSTGGTIAKEFVTLFSWGIDEQGGFDYTAWMSVGYYHYRSNTPRHFVRWRLGAYYVPQATYHGNVSYDRYVDYFIWYWTGGRWQAFIDGGLAEEIYLPFTRASVHAEMNSSRNTGDLYGWWRYMKQYNNGQWTYWDYWGEAQKYKNFSVVVYIVNQHTFGCYNP
jgi:hypothetical protein